MFLKRSVQRKVLLAEDDPDLRWLVAWALQKDGYEVIEAADGIQLLALLKSESVVPNGRSAISLIISDLRMPGASGLDVLTELRRFDSTMPFILLTGFGDQSSHKEARRLDAAMFDKPFELDDLRAAVRFMSNRS